MGDSSYGDNTIIRSYTFYADSYHNGIQTTTSNFFNASFYKYIHVIQNMYRTSKDMLDRIIAIDESWLRSYDPQDSQSAKRWCLPSQEP